MSKTRCCRCQKLGHYAKDCRSRRKSFIRYNASTTDAEERPQREKAKEFALDQEEKNIRKEYYLIFALFRTISNGSETWLVDSGASKHMTGYISALPYLKGKNSPMKVELGDDATYDIQGVGSTSFQLDFGTISHIEGILYVPGLKKNLLSVSVSVLKIGIGLGIGRGSTRNRNRNQNRNR